MTTATQSKPNGAVAADVEEVPVTLEGLDIQTRGEIDIQVATANRYPRSVARFVKEATEMATLDEETAEACFYALPRGGKSVEGPSARLAEIVANAWGNMRIEGKPIDESEKFITSRGVAWDLQKNVAIGFECRRRITDKNNRRYNDDMIGVTANAATSIAIRNAVFKVVPSAFWRPIYKKCREVAVGTQQTLADRRAKMLEYFQKMGVSNARVFTVLGVEDIEDITLTHLATLKGLATAIKDGETSIDDAFAAGGDKAPRQTDLPKPPNYDEWLTDLQSVADEGSEVLADAWAQSGEPHRKYLNATQPELWPALKQQAAAVKTEATS